jgi:uncharacterized protein (TIGR03435 family)
MEHAGIPEFVLPAGRFEAKCTTVKFLLEWAYDLQPTQHSRGPEWTETERFAIIAKADSNAAEKEMKLMARALLVERFALKFHYEKKELPVYTMSLGKSAPKLFPPKEGEVHGIQMSRQGNTAHVVLTRFTLGQLSDIYSRQLERPMLNQTGLDGEFDFTLDLTPDETRPSTIDATILITALREQLNLALKAETLPVDYLVIESIDKSAIAN